MSLPVQDANAACGCVSKWKKCLRDLSNGGIPSGDGTAQFQSCSNDFLSCSARCSNKAECKDECKDAKQSGVSDCKNIFRDTVCPLRGKSQCKKEARQIRNACVKEVRSTFRDCKKACRP